MRLSSQANCVRVCKGLITRNARFVVLFLSIAFMLFSPIFVNTAKASVDDATGGKACFILAPKALYGAGHVGWAFYTYSEGSWTFGATENPGGLPIVPANHDNGSWRSTGTWYDLVHTFQTKRSADSPYESYRCTNVSFANPNAARGAAYTAETSGYNLDTNNCLRKSVDILRAFGVTDLPDSTYWKPYIRQQLSDQPNTYFYQMLPSSFESPQLLS